MSSKAPRWTGHKRTPAAREEPGLGDRSETPVRAAKTAPEIDKAVGSCGSDGDTCEGLPRIGEVCSPTEMNAVTGVRE